MIKVRFKKNDEKPFVKEFRTVFGAVRYVVKFGKQCMAEKASGSIDFPK